MTGKSTGKISAKPKKQPWPKVRLLQQKSGKATYEVDARTNKGGRRGGERLYFDTKGEAETVADQLRIQRRNEGNYAFTLRAEDRRDALAALNILLPHQITLLEAARFYARHGKFVKKDQPLSDTITEYLTQLEAGGASPYNVKGQQYFLARLQKHFPTGKLVDLTTPVLEDWIVTIAGHVAGITRNAYRRDLRRFFNFALRREYLLENPAVKMAEAKEVESVCGILTVGEATRLLNATKEDFLPCVALGLFAGLRPISEVLLLEWRHVDFERGMITIDALRTKSARHRYVKIEPNLMEWLLPYKRRTGYIAPCPNSLKPKSSIYGRRLINARLAAGITHWPLDVLRHTYGTMHLARFRDAGRTALEMGHQGTGMLFKHYRSRVTEQEAEVFWNIRPNRESNIVPMVA